MSVALSVSNDWVGIEKIRWLVVFGDSFSSVGYTSKDPHPSVERPLGIAYPGLTTCERVDEATSAVTFEPNWVGHLVQAVNATRRQSDSLLAYDYAVSGDTVSRMKSWQVKKEFMPDLSTRPDWAPWTSTDTLFVTWIGINDCVWNMRLNASPAQAVWDLFKVQEQLYQAGARNFCLIDVPPIHTFPGAGKSPREKDAYSGWNPMLRENAGAFSASHPDATVLIFSSWDVFERALSDPRSAGFPDNDLEHKTLLVDGFHPSSSMHAVIAKELLAFWGSVPVARDGTA